MYRNHTISVIVPAYQEEELIGDTLHTIPAFVDRIFVIDDYSTDRTRDIAEKISETDLRISVTSHDTNRGVGAAIATGYQEAVREKIDVSVVMAGDNQMDPSIMVSFIDPIIDNIAEYTKGNRLLNPEYRRGMSRWRFFGNTMLTLFTKFSSGYWRLMDPQNGYTAISGKALERLNLKGIYPGYGYCNDLLVKLNVYGFRIMDVEMPSRYGREKSKIRYGRYILKVTWLLIRDFLFRLKMKYIVLSFHPIVFFYLFGFILTIIGIISGIYTLYFKFIEDGPLFIRGVLSLLVFALGIQFLSFALLFDIQENRDISLNEFEH